jgi:hypothetical protein
MARFGRAQPAPPTRGRIPYVTGTITSSVLGVAGAAQLAVTYNFAWYPGAGLADFANLAPFASVARHGSAVTSGSGRLIIPGLPMAPGLLLFCRPDGSGLGLETLTPVPA